VDQLAGARALVAAGGLEPEPAQAAHADAGQDPGDRLLGHREQFGDLGAGEAQASERSDRLDAIPGGGVVDRLRCRGAVEQASLAVGAEALNPLAGRATADLGGPGRLAQRPIVLDDPPTQQAALVQAESGVTVQLHPASSLALSGLSTSQPPRRPG
jgi:hypothetical protein